MRALLQRVKSAGVWVQGRCLGRIDQGLLVYVGVAHGDTAQDARKLARKVVGLRIFEDVQEKLNLSVEDVGGGILAISNFTLQADTRKGRRPSFAPAMEADSARKLHEEFVAALGGLVGNVQTGRFGAEMVIESQADGPVNVLVETP